MKTALIRMVGGPATVTIGVNAIAGILSTGGANCIYALSSNGVTFSASGSGNISTTNCGIYVNGGMTLTGSGNVSAQPIQYYGSYSHTGSGAVSPVTQVGSTEPDPFAALRAPTVSSTCNNTSFNLSGASASTLSPGVYCNGLKISGSGNITFNSGIYIINGTDAAGKSLDFTGSGNLSGNNVMFFITGQNGYTAGPISVAGSGNVSFSAPSSGPYQGLLFYQNPASTYGGTNSFTGSGNVTGTFYFPTTALSFSGSGNANAYEAIVAYKITITGSGNISLQKDTTGQYTGLFSTTANLMQ